MSTILHVSADYPDAFVAKKTSVIKSLVTLVEPSFNHRIVSINRHNPTDLQFLPRILARTGPPDSLVEERPIPAGNAISYEAPPLGLLHRTVLRRLGNWLASKIALANTPDLLLGYKLTVEGLIVQRAAEASRIPYAIVIQGNTDTRIISARPDLRPQFAKIYHDAACVFSFTPWAVERIEEKLGKRTNRPRLVACPTELDTPIEPNLDGEGMVSLFHLRNAKIKNLKGIALAMRALAGSKDSPQLSIIGGGNQSEWKLARKLASASKDIRFEDALDREAIAARLNCAEGLLLPSFRESFGLAFIEALFAGIPIIYPKGTAIDGYFDGCSFAIAVNAKSPAPIARAILHLHRNNRSLKQELASWQKSSHAHQFQRRTIAKSFAAGLEAAISLKPPFSRGH